MFMSTEDNFLFSHFPSVIYMTINVKLNKNGRELK